MEEVCIGVDVGGTNLRLALVGRGGTVFSRVSEPTDAAADAASFLGRLAGAVERLRDEAEGAGMRAVAAGVGVPGLVSPDGVIRSSVHLEALRGADLARQLPLRAPLPVLVMNDANACAVGEHLFGAGRGYRSFIMVTLGTGVGAGLILDGRLWTGADGWAGELGHVTVEPEGRPCRCGNRGCLEQYASATAIATGSGGSEAVALRARGGDGEARARFEEAGRYLGIAAAGVLNLLNLEALVLGGGGAESFELLAPALKGELASRSLPVLRGRVKVGKGSLGADAGVLGAAATAFEAFGSAAGLFRDGGMKKACAV